MTNLLELLTQPASTAILGALAGFASTLIVVVLTGHLASKREVRAYQRQRHDRFEDVLTELANVVDKWERTETSLLYDYGDGYDYRGPKSTASLKNPAESRKKPADLLRQSVTDQLNKLQVLAPSDSKLRAALATVRGALETSYGTRTAIEGAIDEGRLQDDETQHMIFTAPQAVFQVSIAVFELFDADTKYVEAQR